MTGPYDPRTAIPTGSSVPVPTDSGGSLDVWNLPTWLKDYEKSVARPFFVGTHQQDVSQSSATGYSMGEHSGNYGGVSTSPGEHSGSYNGPPSTKEAVPSYASAEDIMKNFAAMAITDPAQFSAIQKDLLAGGWYGSTTTKVMYGMNPQTEDALAKAMGQYIKTNRGAGIPIKFEDFLSQYAQNNSILNGNMPGGTGSGTTGSLAPSVVTLTDPNELVRYAQMAAQQALGRALKPDELNRFVTEFHQQQLQAATQTVADKTGAKAAGDSGIVGMVDRSQPRAAAVGFVESNNQDEFAQHQIQGYTDAFLNMFLPNASAAPNIPTDPSAIGY